MGNCCRTPKYVTGMDGSIGEGTRVQVMGWHFIEFGHELKNTSAEKEWFVGTVTKIVGKGKDGVRGDVIVEFDDEATVCGGGRENSFRFDSWIVNVLQKEHPGYDAKVMGGSASKGGISQ